MTSELRFPHAVLIDTHIWVWGSGNAGGRGRFAESAATSIEEAARDRRLFVSAASVWEIALKAEKGQYLVAGDLRAWVRDQTHYPGVRLLPMTASLAIDATALPEWLRRDGRPHRDPADRFLVAEARRKNAVLVTCDETILDYARAGHVRAYDAR